MRSSSFVKVALCGIQLLSMQQVTSHGHEQIFRKKAGERHSYASSSVLAKGEWVKIRVKETGIYKLTYEALIGMGFSNPSQVQVHGYGGEMLSENFLLPTIDDLPQLSVWVEKGNDGIFNNGDYILFYAKGPIKNEYYSIDEKFNHINNPYSDYGYYFITESNTATRQMSAVPLTRSYEKEFDTFNDWAIYENEWVNIGKTGRELYGEDFSYNNSQNFTLKTPGIANSNAYINVNFIAKATAATPVTVRINGGNILTGTVPKSDGEYDHAGEAYIKGIWSEGKQETNTVNITYAATGHSNSRLNYIRINYDRILKLYGAYTLFRNTDATGKQAKYSVSGINQHVKIWNITDNENIREAKTEITGNSLYFTSHDTSLQEFVVLDVTQKDAFPTPDIIGKIPNQNLHQLQQTDMVIITHPDFIEQAERIADLHRMHDNLRVHVVTTDAVYNEFSSGTPDATAYRRFMKMFYDRGKKIGDEKEMPRYLLLFGDGTFDNRSLQKDIWNTREKADKILTYQSYNSISKSNSCVIDDYFGFLNDEDGWSGIGTLNPSFDTNFKKALVCLGIGRLPVRNITEAKNVTDKIINYVINPVSGAWKNNVCFIADDNDNFSHMIQADQVATDCFENTNKEFIVNKIYLETFKKAATSSGYTYPDANIKLKNLLRSGLLMFNYTGHAMPSYLATEQIYTKDDASTMQTSVYPLFITATCEFSRFDDNETSAGEHALLNPKGGGIALFSTTRVVYPAENCSINKQLCTKLFVESSNYDHMRLGDALRLAKKHLIEKKQDLSLNKLSYILLGDPALKLALPEYTAAITTVNNHDAFEETKTFGAGESITISGQITDPNGNRQSDFSGLTHLTLYDAKEILYQPSGKKVYDRSRVLYSGKEFVSNGEFTTTFIIPKDMSYSYETGRMNIYAIDPETKKEANGYYENFLLGGTNPTGGEDINPPKIHRIYLNNPEFTSNNKVNSSPVFFAEVEDETGINISGHGIGHDPVVIIDNSAYMHYGINEYFIAETGNSRKGSFKYNIPTLSPGKHLLTFRVWDIMNNSSVSMLNFEVEENLSPKIFDLFVHPNPAKTVANFYLKHDRPDSNITVKIDVFNLTGTKLWSFEDSNYSETFNVVPIEWKLTTDSGSKIPPGVYIYRASISSDESSESTESKKLIVLNP